MNYVNQRQETTLDYFVDAKKAFDRLEWEFIKTVKNIILVHIFCNRKTHCTQNKEQWLVWKDLSLKSSLFLVGYVKPALFLLYYLI